MNFIAEHMLYISAAYYVGAVLICAIVPYYTLVKKADHNLQLRDIVFRGIISFFWDRQHAQFSLRLPLPS